MRLAPILIVGDCEHLRGSYAVLFSLVAVDLGGDLLAEARVHWSAVVIVILDAATYSSRIKVTTH